MVRLAAFPGRSLCFYYLPQGMFMSDTPQSAAERIEHWNYSGLPPVELYNAVVDMVNTLEVEVTALRAAKEAAETELDLADKTVENLSRTLAAAVAKNQRLEVALRKIAEREMCSDENKKLECDGASGPYCQAHVFDELLVEEARAALADPPSEAPS